MTNSNQKVVRYVVVVHGMGEPRPGETAIEVINRFAEARAGALSRKSRRYDNDRSLGGEILLKRFRGKPQITSEPLTLGMILDQLNESPWAEFEQIPTYPPKKQNGEFRFIGRTSDKGEDLRFVDIHWNDISTKCFAQAGQSVKLWVDSVLDRLESRGNDSPWVRDTLHTLRDTLVPIQKFMSMRDPKLSETIFNKFLGDVQMYAEYETCRGLSVRRFHRMMADIDATHYEREADRENRTGEQIRAAEYTVLSHSLGTAMSFDALTLAHADNSFLSKISEPGGPFIGYADDTYDSLSKLTPYWQKLRERENKRGVAKQPKLDWIGRVKSFVTMGSPIDKFLVLWWYRYEHLTKTDWIDHSHRGKPDTPTHKPIRHYNYCDESDPVGHELDVMYSASATKHIFKSVEEKIFVRYPIPGMAHVKYWKDKRLFARILDKAVDDRDVCDSSEFVWFDKHIYKKVLWINYRLIPTIFFFAMTATLYQALTNKTLMSVASYVATSIAIYWLAQKVMGLTIDWRMALRMKTARRKTLQEGLELRRKLGIRHRYVTYFLGILWPAVTITYFGNGFDAAWIKRLCDSILAYQPLQCIVESSWYATVADVFTRDSSKWPEILTSILISGSAIFFSRAVIHFVKLRKWQKHELTPEYENPFGGYVECDRSKKKSESED